jgi:hypothetical protein
MAHFIFLQPLGRKKKQQQQQQDTPTPGRKVAEPQIQNTSENVETTTPLQ